MPGPWEKYASAPSGPWDKYAQGQPIQPQAAPYDLSTDTGQSPLVRGLATAVNTALPVQAIQEMAGQMGGSRPHDPMALASGVGQLALAAPMFMAGPAGTAARMGAGAAGATAGGLEAMDVKSPVTRAGLPFIAALAAGHFQSPRTSLQAVPKGQEANAVARLAQGMGIDVAESQPRGLLKGLSPAPQDIAGNWETAINSLGQKVGETKGPALETNARIPEILRTMRGVNSGLEAPGVLNTGAGPIAALSNNPAALNLVQQRLNDAIEAVRANKVSPEQAMEGLNNALEGLKSTIAQSGRFNESMAGAASGAGSGGWQQALDTLAKDPEALATHNAANTQFRKGLALQGMVQKAIGGGAGEEPGFNPRVFTREAATANTGPNKVDLSMFEPHEQDAIRQLTEQKPGLIRELLQKYSDMKKGLYQEPLRFHPGSRLYEQAPTMVPRAGTVAVAAPAAYRSATYDPSKDPNLTSLRQALQR